MGISTQSLRLIKYACLQTIIGPSLICDLLVFIYFIRYWRKEIIISPQNHVILCLLIVSFTQKTTDSLLCLYFFRWGNIAQETDRFCIFWNWWDYSLLTVNLELVAWCCIERHFFIFHSQMMKKKRYLILFHYIPLIICLLYTPTFYVAVIFFQTLCTNVWDYTYLYCGSPCYAFVPSLGAFDWLFHYATPIFIMSLANLFLFSRVVCQKIKQRRPVEWNRQKRMIIQLVFLSSLYLILITPEVIVGVIEAIWSPTFALDIQINYFFYISNFVHQFLPFVIIVSLPNMHKEFKRWIEHMKRFVGGGARRIHPFVTTVSRDHNRVTSGAT